MSGAKGAVIVLSREDVWLAAVVLVGVAERLRRAGRRRRRGWERRPGGGPAWYRGTYLQSEHWAAFRHGWWQRHAGARCERCGAGHPLDLHHVTRVRLGHERDGDVIPLCRHCHDQVEADAHRGIHQ